MFSIYKMSSFAVVAAISASVLMSGNAIAETTNAAGVNEAPMTLAAADTVSRSEARRMVRAQLKADGKGKLRVGATTRSKGTWLVTITSSEGIPVYKVRVDTVSGEISRA